MQRLLPRPVCAALLTFTVAPEDFPAQMSTECLVIKPANLRFRPIAVVRFSSFADVLLGPFGVLALSLGYVSRVAPSAHAQGLRPVRSPGTNSPLDCLCPGSLPRRRPVADGSSFTSLRGPPDCRSPAPCLRATVARNHVCCKGGLGLAAARMKGAENDCRSPPACLRATVACKRCCRKGGLGLDAARTRG